ncbi:Dynein light chain type 1 family protein [Perilla frutescens var. hirtella]|nr:Dynein light chain type 1 family protein [Perilla frutescens var. hirtella]
MASDHRQKREGIYVYNMVAEVPRPPAKSSISKGWGSFVRSKTYRERSEREKVVVDGSGGEVAEQPRRSERRSVTGAGENVGSVAALLQVKVLVSDMPVFMQLHAFRCARTTHDALDKFSSKYMAYNIKKEFDKVYGPAWHCIVGSSFGSFVTHSTGCFLYFSMEKLYILVFKTKVQRALLDDQL